MAQVVEVAKEGRGRRGAGQVRGGGHPFCMLIMIKLKVMMILTPLLCFCW